jgi:hypothetical protein
VEKYGTARQSTDGNIIRRMRFACWITKATDTHSEYVILNAFPRQQWLRERAPVLPYAHIVITFVFGRAQLHDLQHVKLVYGDSEPLVTDGGHNTGRKFEVMLKMSLCWVTFS